MSTTLPCSRILCPSPFRYETLKPCAPHHSGVRSFLADEQDRKRGRLGLLVVSERLERNDGLLCGSRKTVTLSFYILESHVLDDVKQIPDIDHGTLLVLLCMYRWLCCAVQKGKIFQHSFSLDQVSCTSHVLIQLSALRLCCMCAKTD